MKLSDAFQYFGKCPGFVRCEIRAYKEGYLLVVLKAIHHPCRVDPQRPNMAAPGPKESPSTLRKQKG